ncbi:LysR substrate-binding domain-containing protein [Sphingomonas sp. TREG-RG-20F-R18-01]|uniref:LysR family transcriptional regulator n=1 Tax=Sphingomonas sp. TREG-RG-20F-R18-01 TaxID=2914982 RepID=UPI001F55DA15|nr:LysR substrate-binding domain-containing protein [Sphingomonas sp. TREG-RG-20F-R18-01]
MTMDSIGPDLLRAFVAVLETGTFTAAARALGTRQSTVSQQIKRLEGLTGRRLFARDTHRVALTVEGESFVDPARRILEAYDTMDRHLTGVPLRGRLRFGASEDFVLSALPDVLASFARRHPEVDLLVTVGLSEILYDAFDAGQLDIILAKRRSGDPRGVTAWREQVAWVARPDYSLDPTVPLPLLLYPPPSVTRSLAIATLDAARRAWRVAFTSASLSALTAAARAGVGIMPHSQRLLPAGLARVTPEGLLPVLPEIEFVILGPGRGERVAEALTRSILQWASLG